MDYTAQPYESFIMVTLAYVALNFLILQLMSGVRRHFARPGLMGE